MKKFSEISRRRAKEMRGSGRLRSAESAGGTLWDTDGSGRRADNAEGLRDRYREWHSGEKNDVNASIDDRSRRREIMYCLPQTLRGLRSKQHLFSQNFIFAQRVCSSGSRCARGFFMSTFPTVNYGVSWYNRNTRAGSAETE